MSQVASDTGQSAGKRYHLTTYGCQMNEHDSERLKGMLEALDYEECATRDDAELILFNTCSIRENADQRFVTHLYEAKRIKKLRPDTVVGIGGCWAQSVKDEIFGRFPFVDVAFGPGQVHRLAEFLLSDSLASQSQFDFAAMQPEQEVKQVAPELRFISDDGKQQGFFEFEGFTARLPERRERRFQAWVQISVGCNCRCSYCIVPSTRGREVSRPAAEIVDEIQRLADAGVVEVTLLGQNVNSYGRDLPVDSKVTFSQLLAQIDQIEGISRLRYTSPHPKDMREDVIRAHAELPSVCEHIHLPLQSGSSTILKAMRRTYNRERYMERVRMIRDAVPDCAITTDIIVGFPGETEADFQETLEVVQEVQYDAAFTYIFSPRRETDAALLEDSVSHEVKVERMERLVSAVQAGAQERSKRFVGRSLEVLVEGPSRKDPTRLSGRSRHSKVVHFIGDAQPGELVTVDIEEATSLSLLGTQKPALVPSS